MLTIIFKFKTVLINDSLKINSENYTAKNKVHQY